MKKKDARFISRGLDRELSDEEVSPFEKLKAENSVVARTSKTWEAIGHELRAEAASAGAPDAYRAWQDIRREIRQSERRPAETGRHAWRFRLAAAAAALLVIGILSLSAWSVLRDGLPHVLMVDAGEQANRVDWVVAEIPGATTVIYTDVETDMTVIWMDVAQNGKSRDS